MKRHLVLFYACGILSLGLSSFARADRAQQAQQAADLAKLPLQAAMKEYDDAKKEVEKLEAEFKACKEEKSEEECGDVSAKLDEAKKHKDTAEAKVRTWAQSALGNSQLAAQGKEGEAAAAQSQKAGSSSGGGKGMPPLPMGGQAQKEESKGDEGGSKDEAKAADANKSQDASASLAKSEEKSSNATSHQDAEKQPDFSQILKAAGLGNSEEGSAEATSSSSSSDSKANDPGTELVKAYAQAGAETSKFAGELSKALDESITENAKQSGQVATPRRRTTAAPNRSETLSNSLARSPSSDSSAESADRATGLAACLPGQDC